MQDSKRGEKGGTYQINVREYRRAIKKDIIIHYDHCSSMSKVNNMTMFVLS
jgi:hypothetical protein